MLTDYTRAIMIVDSTNPEAPIDIDARLSAAQKYYGALLTIEKHFPGKDVIIVVKNGTEQIWVRWMLPHAGFLIQSKGGPATSRFIHWAYRQMPQPRNVWAFDDINYTESRRVEDLD